MGTKKKEMLVQFNQDLIIQAARKLFEKNGITATRMDDIAKEADLSKSTLYVYFKSKQAILDYIIYEQMLALKETLERCVQQEEDLLACYDLICQAHVEYQQKYPVYYELMLEEIKVTQADIEEGNVLGKAYQVGEELNDIIKIVIERGIKAGMIREDIKVIPTILFLWSGINETIRFANQKALYLEMRLGMTKEEYMKYSFDLLLESIRRSE